MKRLITPLVFLSLIWPGLLPAQSSKAEPAISNDVVFARINERTISYGEFMQIFQAAVRNKFYHGEVPAQELANFQRRVGKDIIEQILIHDEALRLGLTPDHEQIQAGLAAYDAKYQNSPEFQSQKERTRQFLTEQLERRNLITQIRTLKQNIEQPDQSAVKAFYLKHPEKFTEPKRVWVSVILLSVPPSSTNQVWIDAEAAANGLINQINQGAAFADVARQHSQHPSAGNGGDLGYLHDGMLEGDPQAIINKMKIGDISAPVHVLEGITIFRLNGIQPAKLKTFAEVEQRAKGLLYNETQESVWNQHVKNLIEAADIYVNEDLYAPVDEK